MRIDEQKLTKINRVLLLLILVFAFMYFGAPFVMPFIFGLLFASLMTPFSNLLESFRIKRVLSSFISTLVVFVVIGAVIFLLIHQIDRFISDLPSFRSELQLLIKNTQNFIASLTNISHEDQSLLWQEKSVELMNRLEPQIIGFVGNLLHTLFIFLLVLIYMFLLLLYRDKIYDFVMMYTNEEKYDVTKEVMTNINKVIYKYLLGRVKVMALLGIMFYITFIIFGLPHAILLTIFGALITIIPYFGPFLSGLLPIVFAFIFFDTLSKAFLFSGVIITIQLVESYVLEPLIIGKEVKLSPLIVIIAVVLGGLVWGIAGMVLFVPLFAMLKIISLKSPGFEPIGFLLGNAPKEDFEKDK